MTARMAMTGLLLLLPLVVAFGLAQLVRVAEQRDTMARRLQSALTGHFGTQPRNTNVYARLLLGVSGFGRAVAGSGVLSGKALDGIRKQLSSAGFRSNNAVGLFLGTKIILVILLPVLAAVSFDQLDNVMLRRLLLFAAAVVGLLLPEYVLKSLRGRYTGALDLALPDMLDMLVMCTESGLSLEPALSRVGVEIIPIHPTMAREIALTSNEMVVLTDPRAAFANLGERTGQRGLIRLASTLTQTLQYGTPLAPALRSLTAEMRQEMLTRFEERAGRLPSLLTVVMIVFILPSLFIVIGGPAALQVLQQMGK